MSEMSKITFGNESSANYFGNVAGGVYLDFTNVVLSADYVSFDMNDRFSTWKDVWQGLFGLTDAENYQYYFDSEEGNMLWIKLNINPDPVVPEPATILIFGLGISTAALAHVVRRKRK
jgi:hypothetical protein